jgi:DNA polymerase-3 subunit beta
MSTFKYEVLVQLGQLKALKLFVPKKDIRYYLNGIYVEFNQYNTIFVATDGHRLLSTAIYNNDIQHARPTIGAIIPIETIESLLKLKSKVGAALLSLDIENNVVKKIHIVNDAIKLETLPIDAKYPDFRRVFPESVSYEAGNYDFSYLDDFNKAAQYISGVKNQKASLSQNGTKAALVDIDCIDCAGVIMPLNVQSNILTKPKFLFDEPKLSVKEAA